MVNDVIKDSVESAKYDVKNVKMFLDFFHGSGSGLRKKSQIRTKGPGSETLNYFYMFSVHHWQFVFPQLLNVSQELIIPCLEGHDMTFILLLISCSGGDPWL